MIRWTKRLVVTLHATALALALSGSPAYAVLHGDCGDDGTVFIGDVQQCVNIFLSPGLLPNCTACDQMNDGSVDMGDVQGAANCFLNPAGPGCLMATPVPTPTSPPSPTDTPAPPTSTPTNTNTVPPATNTPIDTNTIPAPTSTPSNTIPPPTDTATNTPVTPTSTPVDTATATPTAGGLMAQFDLRLVPGQGICAGKCSGGPVEGRPCQFNFECFAGGECLPATGRTCLGGPNHEMPCTSQANCGLPAASGCRQNPIQLSCAIVQLPILQFLISLIGELSIEFGVPDANGVSQVRIPQESLNLVPATTTFGTACLAAGADAIGIIDCDGGEANLNVTLEVDHDTAPGSPTNYGQRCKGGSNDGNACTTHANCPGTDALCAGFQDDPTCDRTLVQPSGAIVRACPEAKRLCLGGDNAGNPCNNDALCPGSTCSLATCVGGTSPGTACVADSQCPGAGTCGSYLCRGGVNELMACTTDVDCPEGRCIPCNATSPHFGACNSPTNVTLDGTLEAGDMVIVMPLAIVLTQTEQFGPDGIACTEDDTTPPPNLVPVILTTGRTTSRIFDYGAIAGRILAPEAICAGLPCGSRLTGKKFSCEALQNGVFDGAFVGSFPALEVQGDLTTVFQFVAEPRPEP